MTTQQKTILIVDDEEIICESIASDLERLGFNTVVAYSTKQAFEAYQKHKIDLVLTDLRMPGEDGIELVKRIREWNQDSPIIILITAYTETPEKYASKLGINGILQKPFTSEMLRTKIAQYLKVEA